MYPTHSCPLTRPRRSMARRVYLCTVWRSHFSGVICPSCAHRLFRRSDRLPISHRYYGHDWIACAGISEVHAAQSQPSEETREFVARLESHWQVAIIAAWWSWRGRRDGNCIFSAFHFFLAYECVAGPPHYNPSQCSLTYLHSKLYYWPPLDRI